MSDTITLMKQRVLDMAIRGELVEQREDEGTAEELLREVEENKKCLIKKKEIKKEKYFPGIDEENIPFEVPKTWSWVQLKNISNKIHYGYTASAAETGEVKLLRITDIQNGKVDWEKVPYCKIEENKTSQYSLNENDLLIARTGGTVGKSFIVNEVSSKAVFASYLIRIVLMESETAKYIYAYLNSSLYFSEINRQSKGTGQPNVNAQHLSGLILPLPPLAEQKRIVSKIESLFSIIDQIAEYKQDSLKIIEKIRKTAIQNAIIGELVEQDENDEPASELVKKIHTEKERLIKEKEIKKGKTLSIIGEDNVPFEIPYNWEWTKLGDITNYGNNKTVQPNQIEENTWVLDLEDIEKNTSRLLQIVTNSTKNVKSSKNSFKKGDVLYGKLRPYLKKVIIAPEDGVCTSEIVPFRGYCEINVSYLLYTMKSDYMDNTINNKTAGTKMPRLGTETARNLLIPLPPLAEQKRIVEKLDQIMAICDQMEEILDGSREETPAEEKTA